MNKYECFKLDVFWYSKGFTFLSLLKAVPLQISIINID